MNFEESQTKKNLIEAFSAEAQAYTRYMFFSDKALSDGYVQISNIFKGISNDEKTHAFIWYRLLNDEMINDTYQNLENAHLSEKYVNEVMYKNFEEIALGEGFTKIANKFKEVSEIEKNHEDIFKKLYNNIQEDIVFSRGIKTKWQCLHCGHIHYGISAPNVCPVCNHEKGYFQIESENF